MNIVTKKLAELAAYVGAELHGDGEHVIAGIATLQHAKADRISFLTNPVYRQYLKHTQAGAVIITAHDLPECPVNALVTPNPYLAYAKIAKLYQNLPPDAVGIHPTAVVDKTAKIHPSAAIGAQVVIGAEAIIAAHTVIGAGCVVGERCEIAEHSKLFPRVTLYHEVKIGKNVIIHSGAVIGSDGFGLAKDQEKWYKIPQLGRVVIADDVEIGANTTIDRGALEDTIIEQGVKLDNQIQVGHNVHIGAHTAIAGCVGIAGSTTIGKHCGIGGGVGILGHLSIADNVMITAGSGVSKSITEPGVYSSGIDIQSAAAWRRNRVRISQLDAMAHKLRNLEKQLMELRVQLNKEESL